MAISTASANDRVRVTDTSSADYGREGKVVSCDAAAKTCTVRLDGDSSDKVLKCSQLDACPA